MDKKKLIEYTRLIRPIARKKGLLSASQLVELFLSEHDDFFDDPDPVKESFDELFEEKENRFKDEGKISESNSTPTYPFNWYVVSQSQGVPHRCPICNGSGIVPPGFYDSTSGFSTSNVSLEPCRQCSGTGIIWSK